MHIDADPASISRNVSVDVPIVGDAKNALKELIARTKPLALGGWIQKLNELKAEYPVKIESDVLNPQDIIERLNTLFDALIVTTDVGRTNFGRRSS